MAKINKIPSCLVPPPIEESWNGSVHYIRGPNPYQQEKILRNRATNSFKNGKRKISHLGVFRGNEETIVCQILSRPRSQCLLSFGRVIGKLNWTILRIDPPNFWKIELSPTGGGWPPPGSTSEVKLEVHPCTFPPSLVSLARTRGPKNGVKIFSLGGSSPSPLRPPAKKFIVPNFASRALSDCQSTSPNSQKKRRGNFCFRGL